MSQPEPAIVRLAEQIFIQRVAQEKSTTWDFRPFAQQSFDAAKAFIDYLKSLSSSSQSQTQTKG